jgi:signal transduction histidine kinase
MNERASLLPPWMKGLSARLLLLTIAFVMLAEVLIYAPSIARFRQAYLEERIAAGHLAILALQATPDYMVSEELERELLDSARVYLIALRRPDGVKLRLGMAPAPAIALHIDLRQQELLPLIGDAFATLNQSSNRVLRIVGVSPRHPQAIVEVVMDEAPMRAAMLDYSQRILALSIVISLTTAAMVFLSLQWLIVRPIRRMIASMTAFRDDPTDASRLMLPGGSADEIGTAQRELARMQQALRAALHQKTRLAALGTAVTKINHDLRNMLATARLVSDRLTASDDPQVRGSAPRLVAALDRAVALCTDVLHFAGEGPPATQRRPFELRALVEEVGDALPARAERETEWIVEVPAGLSLEADREQIFRLLANLGQNAFQAGATRVAVTAHRDARVVIEVADNGPGLPPRARDRLFQPFSGSARPGGTGLGLAIAQELAAAHGGAIALARSDAGGTVFRLTLPG